jgi:hypothetical protein
MNLEPVHKTEGGGPIHIEVTVVYEVTVKEYSCYEGT